MSGRTAVQPTELGPYALSQRTEATLSHHGTHHLSELYPQPAQFPPARWEETDPIPYEYLPFSAGSPMWLGAAFATMEMKLALPMILQRFRLQPPAAVKVSRTATMMLGLQYGMPV